MKRRGRHRHLSSVNRWSRMARLTAVTGRIAWARARTAVRIAVTPRARRDEVRSASRARASGDLVETLGAMKGLAAKLGQMASYLDETLPAETREALAQLQSDIPPMSAEAAAAVIREELGKIPERVFHEWDPEPFAAASIGQVHRAVTRSGVEVAVKVQYPGVADAVHSDLDNAGLLFSIIKLGFPNLDPAPLLEELRARVGEEIDYRIESSNQQLFADYYRDHPFIHVPDVLPELSTSRVLTSEMASGARFTDILSWSQEERDMCGETIFRYVFRSLYAMRAFNGDPHPGNYLFRPGGRVTFMDYGLVKRFDEDEGSMFQDMVTSMVTDHDPERFRKVIENAGLLVPGADVPTSAVAKYFASFYQLVLENETKQVSSELASQMVRSFTETGNPVTKFATVPAAFVIIQRINLGLYALLAQLGATRNWRLIAEELWPTVLGPPSTTLGEEEAEWLSSRPPLSEAAG